MSIQFRTNQYADDSVTPAKADPPFNFALMVDFPYLKSNAAQAGAPPAAPTVHEQWIANNWGAGYTNNVIYEAADKGSGWVYWKSLGALASGHRGIIYPASAGGSFVGKESKIVRFTTTDRWEFTAARSGMIAGTRNKGSDYLDRTIYGYGGSTYTGIELLSRNPDELCGEGIGMDSALNKLRLNRWHSPVSVMKLKDDSDMSMSYPSGAVTGDAFVVNGWTSTSGLTDGDIVEWNGSSWVVIQGATAGGYPINGTRAIVERDSPAGTFTTKESKLAEWRGDGTSTYPGQWTFVTAYGGAGVICKGGNSIYENQFFVCDSTTPPNIWVAGGAGAYVGGDGIEISGTTINVDLSVTSGLEFSGGGLQVHLGAAEGIAKHNDGGLYIDPTLKNPISAGNPVVDYDGMMEWLARGIFWQEPVKTKSTDSWSAAETEPGAPETGDAFALPNGATGWTGGFYAPTGSVAEWIGSEWTVVVLGDGSDFTDGLRVLVKNGAAAPFAGHADDIAIYSGGWTFSDPIDGHAFLVDGYPDYWMNTAWVYESGGESPGWIQFGGLGVINAGKGLKFTGSTLNVTLAGVSGLEFSGSKELMVLSGLGITLNSTGVNVDIAAYGLMFSGNKLAVEGGLGITLNATGVGIDKAAYGLVFSGNKLALDEGRGITLNGTGVNVDPTVQYDVLGAAEATGNNWNASAYIPTGQSAASIADIMVWRNGQLQKRVAGSPAALGEYNWSASTSKAVFFAGTLENLDEMAVLAFAD